MNVISVTSDAMTSPADPGRTR